jgi:hypothetical protein
MAVHRALWLRWVDVGFRLGRRAVRVDPDRGLVDADAVTTVIASDKPSLVAHRVEISNRAGINRR